jgi:hypothetical protein
MGQHANNQSSQAPVLGMAAALPDMAAAAEVAAAAATVAAATLPTAAATTPCGASPPLQLQLQPLLQTRTRTTPPTTAASAQAADATATGARLPTYYYTCDRRADKAKTVCQLLAGLGLKCFQKGTGAAGDPRPHCTCPLHCPNVHQSIQWCSAYP